MIHQTAIIYPGVKIEDGVEIGAYSVIGGPPEDKKFFGKETGFTVHIKKGVRISDLVTIHSGTIHDTVIGEDSCIFAHSHIGHDVEIAKNCIVGGGVSLAGHTKVLEGANVSGRSGTIPFVVIGAYSFIGAFSLVTNHVPPGQKWIGFPARFSSNNDIGIQRAGFTLEGVVLKYMEDFNKLTEGEKL